MRKLWIGIVLVLALLVGGCQGDPSVSNEIVDAEGASSDAVMPAYKKVLQNEMVFFMYNNFWNGRFEDVKAVGAQGEYTMLGDYLGTRSDASTVFYVRGFTVVDMNGDGLQEVIVETPPTEERIVLWYKNGEVYGALFTQRGLNALKTDGTFTQSDGANNTQYCRLQFMDKVCQVETLAASTDEDNTEFTALIEQHAEKEDVQWYSYDAESIEEIIMGNVVE